MSTVLDASAKSQRNSSRRLPMSGRKLDGDWESGRKRARKSHLCVKNEPSQESESLGKSTHRVYHRPLTPDTSPIRLLPFSPSQVTNTVACYGCLQAIPGRQPLCFTTVVYLFLSFSSPNILGWLSPNCHIFNPDLWNSVRNLGTPSTGNLAAPNHEILARFQTTSQLDHEYLPNTTRHCRSEDGVSN